MDSCVSLGQDGPKVIVLVTFPIVRIKRGDLRDLAGNRVDMLLNITFIYNYLHIMLRPSDSEGTQSSLLWMVLVLGNAMLHTD